jgi:hypothetical protein
MAAIFPRHGLMGCNVTGADAFRDSTGHDGSGVTVAVLDTGVSC